MTDPESITYAEYRGMVEKIEYLEGVVENLTEELRLAHKEIGHLRAIVHATTAEVQYNNRAERASAATRGEGFDADRS